MQKQFGRLKAMLLDGVVQGSLALNILQKIRQKLTER